MPRASRSSGLLAALVYAAAAVLWLILPADAGLNTAGKWTKKTDTGARWSHIPVHLVLTRGSGYHSQILWYNSHLEGTPTEGLLGGVWGWNPALGVHEANCDSYPANSFTALTMGNPGTMSFVAG